MVYHCFAVLMAVVNLVNSQIEVPLIETYRHCPDNLTYILMEIKKIGISLL